MALCLKEVMAYDIHIAKTRKLAERSGPIMSIGTVEHETVFSAISKISKNYPMINSMGDFYRDTTYYNTALDNLLLEANRLVSEDTNKSVNIFAKNFLELVVSAKDQTLDIYCFCD